jgi:hypothetical protein
MSSAVLCGRCDTARSTARRWGVTFNPCWWSNPLVSTGSSSGMPPRVTRKMDRFQIRIVVG